jgi:hypothetical protein
MKQVDINLERKRRSFHPLPQQCSWVRNNWLLFRRKCPVWYTPPSHRENSCVPVELISKSASMSYFPPSLSQLANSYSAGKTTRTSVKIGEGLPAACASLNLNLATQASVSKSVHFWWLVRKARASGRERMALLVSAKCRSEQKSFNNQCPV